MAKNKTNYTDKDVIGFINEIENEKRRAETLIILDLYKDITRFEPKMFGPTIIGFGNYNYKYESGHEGNAPLAAFSPRKNSLVFYLEPAFENREELLLNLGKIRTSKACIYARKLENIDLQILREMISKSIEKTKEKYPN